MAKSLLSSDKRNGIRFEPDAGTIAWIDFKNTSKLKASAFQPTMVALVTEESHRGCGLALRMSKELEVGAPCRVKVGNNPALLGEVRWRVELDSQIMRIGIMFLE